ncbi:hypothetical protein BGLA2_140046 [Burkholderia gladioli]|nr:hypothetical protein BGLA2_140046 [Burkholderia gladioli]
MCTVAEICSTGARVTLSDVPEVLLTATNSEPQVQDAGLAAKAGTYSTASDQFRCRFHLCFDLCFKRLAYPGSAITRHAERLHSRLTRQASSRRPLLPPRAFPAPSFSGPPSCNSG